MEQLNIPTKALISAFKQAKESDSKKKGNGNGYRISRAVSAVAFWYEKLRTAMEYREEYLLRRSAIQRILARKLIGSHATQELFESLLKELIWARYLTTENIDDATRAKALHVLSLYIPVITKTEDATHKNWLISILASELERILAESFWLRQEALANYAYFFFSRQLEVVEDENLPTVTNLENTGEDLRSEIERDLSNQVSEKLQRFVEKNLPPFLVLRDLFEENQDEIEKVLSDSHGLEESVNNICEKKYMMIHQRVRTAIIRSIIYVFLTKMVFVLILEIPVDRWFYGGISYIPLFINSILPPSLMFVLSKSVQIPDKSNTEKILTLLKKIAIDPPESLPRILVSTGHSSRRPLLTVVFSILYGLAFLVSFGLIYYLLSLLGFNIVSKAVFIFFISVVTFFSYRIRRVAHQYLFEEREGIFSPVTDFFMVPILRVGRILSNGLARVNLILFIIDIAIEMPFKVIFDLTDEWSSYIRSKKEEIV
ncbi:MAG: hypothetical protein UW69_C0045G0006 [Microgenomates group bacterium GW2011_GWA2_44_7]|nr:MAG: hypothetical protein UW69_C0045G0006 [Microgenomates group bacterium GW2011_GWA2_44_7]